MGQKQKTEKKKRERLNDGNNNGQATHGTRKPPGPTFSKLVFVPKQRKEDVKQACDNLIMYFPPTNPSLACL